MKATRDIEGHSTSSGGARGARHLSSTENKPVIDTIRPTRYPSSAIAPNLPYLFNHGCFGDASATSPTLRPSFTLVHHQEDVPVVNRETHPEEPTQSGWKDSEVGHKSQIQPSHGNTCKTVLEKREDGQRGEHGSSIHFTSPLAEGLSEGSSQLTSNKDEILKLLRSLPSKFSNATPEKGNLTDLESLASHLPHSEWGLPHVYKQLQSWSSGVPQHSKNAHNALGHQLEKEIFLDSCDGCLTEDSDWKTIYKNHLISPQNCAKVDTEAARGASLVQPYSKDAVTQYLLNDVQKASLSEESLHKEEHNIPQPYLDGSTLPNTHFHKLGSSVDITAASHHMPDTVLPSLDTTIPGRLLLVMRRFPHKIVPILRRRTSSFQHSSITHMGWNALIEDGSDMNSSELVKLEGAVTGASTEQQYNLTMKDTESVYWSIERNQFGLDLAEAFDSSINRVVVIDPGITFALLSQDADVQRSLRRSLRDFLLERNVIPVFLEAYEAAIAERYTEEVLAPLFHYITPPVSTGYHNLDWAGYRELNIAFLNAIVEHYQEGDWILVFNYQLMLLPKMLRERPITRNCSIGFYLSTLFPSSEMYRMLPQREELLRGVLAASFIGFHNFQYKRHFFTACTRVLGVECSGDYIEPDSAVGKGTGARVVTVPRGINSQPWLAELQKSFNHAKISELKERLKGRKVLLGIDTLDYTKGIPNKILAFKKFLVNHPEWASNVIFYQICVPKRQKSWNKNAMGLQRSGRTSRVAGRDILSTVYHLVGAINANFGNLLHQPIHFLLSPLSVENLVCLYGLADIVVITPLRESLSWTAYEFVLCQSYTNKGVLILSEFSGSAQSLGAAAICVNPWDADALAIAIHDALIMKDEEKLERHQYGVNYVLNYDTQSWARNLFAEFCQAIRITDAEKRSFPQPFPYTELIPAVFASTRHRIIILGLRGTLYPSSKHGVDPQIAGRIRLSRTMYAALHVLSQDPNVHITVVSSSPATVLYETLGHLTNITLLADNGHLQRWSKRLRDYVKTDSNLSKTLGAQGESTYTVPYVSKPHNDSGVQKLHVGEDDSESLNQAATFEYTTSDIDLSWMEPVHDSCCYFEQRTPGSFLVRTATSISWNYQGAQREHGTRQARDLLIHLWARPATVAARTDIVLGPHSVEIRSAATRKAAAIERWISVVLSLCAKNPPRECMVLCASNFLPCDEAVFSVVTKEMLNFSTESTSTNKTLSSTYGGSMQCSSGLPCQPNSSVKDMNLSLNLDRATNKNNISPSQDLMKHRMWMCTVGIKPSRAEYSIKDDKKVESILTLLAALTIMEPTNSTHDVETFFDNITTHDGIVYENVVSISKRKMSTSKKNYHICPKDVDMATLCNNPDIQRKLVLAVQRRDIPNTVGAPLYPLKQHSMTTSATRSPPLSAMPNCHHDTSEGSWKNNPHNQDYRRPTTNEPPKGCEFVSRFNSITAQTEECDSNSSLHFLSEDGADAIQESDGDECFSESSSDEDIQYTEEEETLKQDETIGILSTLCHMDCTSYSGGSPCNSSFYTKDTRCIQ